MNRMSLKVQASSLPSGHYTAQVIRARKVRNKPRIRMTFKIDTPPTANVEFIIMNDDLPIGQEVTVEAEKVICVVPKEEKGQ